MAGFCGSSDTAPRRLSCPGVEPAHKLRIGIQEANEVGLLGSHSAGADNVSFSSLSAMYLC